MSAPTAPHGTPAMPDPASEQESLDPLALLAWIDRAADRFEAAWGGETPPQLAPFVDEAKGLRRAQLLKELVKIDLEHRWRSGERRKVEAYLAEWPELRSPDGWLADDLVCFAEQLRQEFGDTGARGTKTSTAPGTPPALVPPAAALRTLGKFQLGALLGKGAFGAVYKARDTELDRTVAIKVPRAGFFSTPEEQERFQREARSTGQLQHPHIVPVYEVGEADGVPYIVSKYVEGRTLASVLAEKRFPFREAAALVLWVARALHYAHSLKVIHRDIKPSNILLDSGGEPHLADFGLAWRDGAGLTLTAEGEVLGTPAYMAPEQAEGRHRDVDQRSDVYGLGVVLYELLAGTLPFAGPTPLLMLQQVRNEEPPPPRRHDRRIPRDLETICLKAMAKDPRQRYATADELADDLQRFLNDELIQARRAGNMERFGRWCRRNPRVALLTGAVFLLLLAAAGTALWSAQVSRASAQVSRAGERTQRREALIQQLQRVRLTPHLNGWSKETWQLTADAAALHADEALRTEAAAALAGLDAHLLKTFEPSASTLAFDPKGRLLLGGTDPDRHTPGGPTRLWDGGDEPRQIANGVGAGMVAFRRDGTPVQLLPGEGAFVVLYNLATQEPISTCPFAEKPADAAGLQVRKNDLDLPVLALGLGGSRLAAALAGPENTGIVAIWDGESGKLVHRFPVAATALAFSADATLLAAGDDKGQVHIWSLSRDESAVTLPVERTLIHCLAFSPDGRRLAVGTAGGTVNIWDWQARRFLPCGGSLYDAYAVAFSPDGTLLVSAGRGPNLLWDGATGRPLLMVDSGDYICAVAFSPDSRRLALSGQIGGVFLYELEHGRGIHTLRGLVGPISKVCFSADGRLLAALAHNWQVGVWDLAEGRLLYVLDTPQGFTADNAAMAFDPEGHRLAFSTGHEAVLWEVKTGQKEHSWKLPPGLVDILAFPARDQLLLFRMETRDRQVPPLSNFHPIQHPRVSRLRNLLAPDPQKAIELPEFNWAVLTATAPANGRLFVVEGIQAGPAGKQQKILVLDGATGKQLWDHPVKLTNVAFGMLDAEGELLAFSPNLKASEFLLVRLATGEVVQSLPRFPKCLGPGARQVVQNGPPRQGGLHVGCALLTHASSTPQVVLGIDDTPAMVTPVFNRAGTLLAWGNTDGTVTVCQLAAIRARLAELDLGW